MIRTKPIGICQSFLLALVMAKYVSYPWTDHHHSTPALRVLSVDCHENAVWSRIYTTNKSLVRRS